MKSVLMAAVGGLVLTAAVTGAANAQAIFGYNLNLSIRAEAAPNFEGGKHYSVYPGGSVALTKPWEFDAFAAPDDAASLAIVNTRRFSFGAAASIRVNRGNDDELRGFHNIGWSLEGGGFMNVWPTKWSRVHVEVLRGITAQDGLLVNTGLDVVAHPRNFNLSVGPRYSWGDAKFNNTYFGVRPDEALASPFVKTPFTAKAGSHYAGVEASAEYKVRPRLRLTFDTSYHHLLGDDERSPLVRRVGNPDQLSAALGLRFMLGY